MKYTNTHIYIHVCLCVWYVCYDCFIMQNQLMDPMILASLLWFSLAHPLLFHALWHRTLVPSSVLLAFLWIPPTPATTPPSPPPPVWSKHQNLIDLSWFEALRSEQLNLLSWTQAGRRNHFLGQWEPSFWAKFQNEIRLVFLACTAFPFAFRLLAET